MILTMKDKLRADVLSAIMDGTVDVKDAGRMKPPQNDIKGSWYFAEANYPQAKVLLIRILIRAGVNQRCFYKTPLP